MSNWTHSMGCIKINGIKKDGLKKIYNLKNNKEYDGFFGNSNNWKHTFKDKKHLVIDHRKHTNQFIENLPRPTGSEGNLELQVCFYDDHYKLWGSTGSSSRTQDYNIKTGELIPFGYSPDLSDEDYVKEGWEHIWYEEHGDNFVICVFGDLRDSDLHKFKKEFDKFLTLLEKYFYVDDINVKATEGWNNKIAVWSYNDAKCKIIYELTHQQEDKGE